MKKHHMPEIKEGGVNVTPLIDIVMTLIIFFMLVAKIGVTRGADKDIKLPSAILGTKIEDMGDTLTLNIHPMPGSEPQVTALVNGENKEVRVNNNGDHELERVLKEFKKVHGDKSKIILHGDRELYFDQLQQVLISVSVAGIPDTAYETKEGPALQNPPPPPTEAAE
ncbi:MAG TPA: biopolymer transporter ExbD [Tepidisphaeraceae bacterium]|nr:biopolymer transporter ExbD [Tepidisphaeraceae bacterium]